MGDPLSRLRAMERYGRSPESALRRGRSLKSPSRRGRTGRSPESALRRGRSSKSPSLRGRRGRSSPSVSRRTRGPANILAFGFVAETRERRTARTIFQPPRLRLHFCASADGRCLVGGIMGACRSPLICGAGVCSSFTSSSVSSRHWPIGRSPSSSSPMCVRTSLRTG